MSRARSARGRDDERRRECFAIELVAAEPEDAEWLVASIVVCYIPGYSTKGLGIHKGGGGFEGQGPD